MRYEFLTVRLKALRCAFVTEDGLRAIASAKEPAAAVSILNDSLFGEAMARTRDQHDRKITAGLLAEVVEEGYLDTLQRLFTLVARDAPELVAPLFSRPELEQVKQALRAIRTGRPAGGTPARFVNLRTGTPWTGGKTYRTAEEFKVALKETLHPFAPALDPNEKEQVADETALERYYFADYLPTHRRLLGDAFAFFADQCDLVNLQTAAILKGRELEPIAVRDCFIPGPGRISQKAFVALAQSAPGAFCDSVAAKTHYRFSPECETSPIRFSLAVRENMMKRYRLKTVTDPYNLWEFFLFLEELSAMRGNLKLALRAMTGDKRDLSRYFIFGKVA